MDVRRLKNLFRFNEEDLLANRRGHFSEKQKLRLDAEAAQQRKSARESAAILFVIAIAGMTIGIVIGSISPTTIGRIAMYFFMGALWPIVWAGKGVQIVRAANALQERHLLAARGPIHILHHGDGEYILQMDGLEFDVDGNPSGAFVEGDEYTIYYVDTTQEILSIDY